MIFKPDALDAAIIDLDGTLVDTMGDFVVAINRMLSDLSLPALGREVIEPLVGKGSEHLIRSVLDHVSNRPSAHAGQGVTAINSGAKEGMDATADGRFPAAWASYQRHYLAVNGQHAAVYPGVMAGLQHLKARGLKLACLTNKPLAFAVPLLKAKELDGFFSVVFGGDSFERKKPDPLPLLKTCEALGSVPARTLMIGDSSNDARAARAAGCPVWLVTYGYNHGEPVRGVDADGFTDTLAELPLAPASP
ncbi:MAG: phosphoglycolate phosphatase [Polaromonas sp.]|nr:phosphoglycolate phosphatase [Polaromonas sp.]